MPSAIGAFCGQCLCLNERSGNQMMPAETGSPANLAGRNLSCQESNGQHVSRPQGSSIFDRIGDRSMASREIRTHGTAQQETPVRAFVKAPRDRLKVRPDYGRNDVRTLIAAMCRHMRSQEVTVSFDMSSLESLYSTSRRSKSEYLRASLTPTGEILLTVGDDESPTTACRASEALCNQTARTALQEVLARNYAGVFNIAHSDWVYETGRLTLQEAFKICNLAQAAHAWGRQETPERVFLDHLTDCLRLGASHVLCSGLVYKFNFLRSFVERWSLVREAMTGRTAQPPWMVVLHSEARKVYGDLPNLGPDPDSYEEAEKQVAAMSRHARTEGVAVAFEESLLESPAGPKQFLRLNKSATGAFSLVLAEDDGGNEICNATKKMQGLAARFAFSNVLERHYPGVLASVQGYRNFMARSGCLTLVEAQEIWNAVKMQHEVELYNGGKSFKDKLVRENDFLRAAESALLHKSPARECVANRLAG